MVLQWKPRNQPRRYSFKDFKFSDGSIIGVFQGDRGSQPDLDIVIKYKDKYTKSGVRTPKHIHWVIDLLIKKEHDKYLTLEFIDYLIEMYDKIEPFRKKEEQQKCELKYTTTYNLKKFEKLNGYGQYSIDFIGHIIELFSIEEKTGFENAFMFKKVLTAIKEEKDIFSIVSTATHNGRL